MRTALCAAFACALIVAPATTNAMQIRDDIGGRIGNYIDRYRALANSGELVQIDGVCLSACTLVVGFVPHDRICVTSRAMLGFHAAWTPGPAGKPVASAIGTEVLWEIYPPRIRKWIMSRGGLTSKMIFLRGSELTHMYPTCP